MHADPVENNAPSRRTAFHYLPPPALFVVSFLAGVQLAKLVPLSLVPSSLEAPAHWLGVAIVVAAVAFLLPAPIMFLIYRTTIVPHRRARRLIVSGPYRITRNPMYVTLVAGYIGAALITNQLWPLLLLAFPVWVLHTRIIPLEEENLMRCFGDEYRAYQQRVRRWV